MLNKKEKKSYGAYNDYFLDDCEVVAKPFDITHVHVKEVVGIPEGIYRYEPRTGILSLDDEHFGIMNYSSVQKEARNGKVVFLKHKATWSDMEDSGVIKKADDADVAHAAQSMMSGLGINKKII
jgi:hypothetical protein